MDDIRHRAGLAAVFSFIFNGLGQLYVGDIRKGLTIMSISVVSMILIIVGGVFIGHWLLFSTYPFAEVIIGIVLLVVGIIIACIVGVYSIVDAYKQAL
ncbi:hypothetical protein ACFL1E_00545 [Candidatus Omnitrophota bacterium]